MARYDWGDGKGRVHSRPKRTAVQLGRAKENKRLDDPRYFTNSLTPRMAEQEARTAAQREYKPVLDQIGLQERQAPVWYENYKREIMTPQQTAAQYQPVIAQQQQTAQETAKPLGLEGQAGGLDAQAAAARGALASLGTAVLQSGQMADTTYNAGRQNVANAAQIGTMAELGQQRQSVLGQQATYQNDYLSKAREAERAYGLQSQHQAVENKAFGLDVAKAQADVRTDRQKVRADRRQDRARQRDKDEDQALARQREKRMSQPKPAKAPPKPYTPAQHHEAKVDLRKAVSLVQGKLGGKTAPDSYWRQAYSALVNEKGMDPALARAAVQLVRGGRVGAKTRSTLERDYGITKFPRGSKRKKPPAYKVPNRPGTAPSGTGNGKGNDSRRPT